MNARAAAGRWKRTMQRLGEATTGGRAAGAWRKKQNIYSTLMNINKNVFMYDFFFMRR
jgi:hypothetical protein